MGDLQAFATNEYRKRVEDAQVAMGRAGLSACVCIGPELLFYFAGYDGHTHFSDQALIIRVDDTEPTLIYRDVDKGIAAETVWLSDQRTYHYPSEPPLALIESALSERTPAQSPIGVCFNSHALKGHNAIALRDTLHRFNIVDASDLIESVRLKKSPAEIAYIREAARLADAGLERVRDVAKTGMTEIQLAGHLEAAMRDRGADYPAMPAWVSSGPRTRGAHKTPTDRVIQTGDRLKLEFAGVSHRYHAVTMQTMWLDRPPTPKVQGIYDVAASALRAGESAITVGAPVADSETAAFAVLSEHGFDLKWHSRFGYGVGIAYPPTWLESLDITRESEQHYEKYHSFCLHIAVRDPVEGLGIMLGGAYILSEQGLECLSGGAFDLTVITR